jgi:hypothetical protein
LHWAIEHADAFPAAWAHSHDPQMMLKIAAYVVPREDLVLAACAVARTVLQFVPLGEDRPRLAIETAEEWAHGRASIRDVFRAAASAAASAAYAANSAATDSAASAFAARAAAHAASAAHAVTVVASADAAARAAANANAANANAAIGAACDARNTSNAEIVRAQLAHRDILADIVNANRGAP